MKAVSSCMSVMTKPRTAGAHTSKHAVDIVGGAVTIAGARESTSCSCVTPALA